MGVLFGAVAGILVLLVVGGGLAWFFATRSDNQQASTEPVEQPGAGAPIDDGGQQPVVPDDKDKRPPPTPIIRPDPIAPPQDATSAAVMLRDMNPERRRVALDWLESTPVRDADRSTVSRALTSILDDPQSRRKAVQLLSKWGSGENVPALVALLDDSHSWQVALDGLSRIEDDEAAEAVARQLTVSGRLFAARLRLSRMGKRAEKHVAKYLFHRDDNVRRTAESLLKGYGTTGSVVMEQAAAALELPDEDIKRSAAEWLAKQNLDPEYQDKVARSLEGLLTDSDPRMKQTAIRALDRWATKDNVKALVGLLDNNQLRPAVVAILGRLKDDQAIAPLALRLHLPPQDQIALVLVSYGSTRRRPSRFS